MDVRKIISELELELERVEQAIRSLEQLEFLKAKPGGPPKQEFETEASSKR
jgi:hypothetical protein